MQAFDFSAAITGTTGAQQQRFQLPHATAPTVWMNLKLWMEKEAVLELIYIYTCYPTKMVGYNPTPFIYSQGASQTPQDQNGGFRLKILTRIAARSSAQDRQFWGK